MTQFFFINIPVKTHMKGNNISLVQPTTSHQNVETILHDPVPRNKGIYYLMSFSRYVSLLVHLKFSM